jgi:hypothetical protein
MLMVRVSMNHAIILPNGKKTYMRDTMAATEIRYRIPSSVAPRIAAMAPSGAC